MIMDDFVPDLEVVDIRNRHFHSKVCVQNGSLPFCESSSLSRLFFPFALLWSRLLTFCCGSDAIPSVCWESWEKEWEASCDWSTARSRIQCGNSPLLCSHTFPQETKSVLRISPLLLGGRNSSIFKVPSQPKLFCDLLNCFVWENLSVSAWRNIPDESWEVAEEFLVNQDNRVVLQGRCRRKSSAEPLSTGDPKNCCAECFWKCLSVMG